MSTEFITTPVDDAFMAEGASKNGEVQAEGAPNFETSHTPTFLHGSGGRMPSMNAIDRAYLEHFVLFAVGTIVLAMIILCCRRMWDSHRRQKRSLKAWTNEIHFRDECESTDESMESVETGQHVRNYPIDRNDWLASVGYENADEGNANPFVFAQKTMSDSSNSSYGGDDDNDIGLFHALNGDSSSSGGSSPPRSPRLTLDNPPPPPRISTTGFLGSNSGDSPPTVSELFQNTIKSHWRMAPPPLNIGGGESSADENFDEELAAVRAELKQYGL